MLKGEYAFFIITNQSGIGMGLFTEHDFKRFNDYLIERLREQEITIEKTYFCPHTGGCDCRKPSTKFIEDIVRKYRVDKAKSWVIGDHPSDVIMGITAGCGTVYLLTGHGKKHFQELESGRVKPTIIAPDFLTAARGIKKHED